VRIIKTELAAATGAIKYSRTAAANLIHQIKFSAMTSVSRGGEI